jgi:pimeloyl-[acyl-carrier protein] methyl ester esterase
MKLHRHSVGAGPDLVMLHGWALAGGVFGEVVERLAEHHRVWVIDLPGHGHSPSPASRDDAATLLALQAAIPPGATLLGWSLGGLWAMRLALAGMIHLSGLILLSTTPRFVQGPDWQPAVPEAALHAFAGRLQDNWRRTVREFLALQLVGAPGAHRMIAALRDQVATLPVPTLAGLEYGLATLATVDLRAAIPQITVPTLVLAGERDTLTPIGAAHWLATNIPDARLAVWADGAHALFASHPESLRQHITDFIAQHR